MATIIHFDISVDDTNRARAFYETLFEWKFTLLPGPPEYFLIETKNLDGKAGIGGGMAKREGPQPATITNFIGVASLDITLEKVKMLGGKVIQHRQSVPGWGYLAVCTDTENNTFGLFEQEKNDR